MLRTIIQAVIYHGDHLKIEGRIPVESFSRRTSAGLIIEVPLA
jgi:hypothetical protein